MSSTRLDMPSEVKRSGRRAGYGVAVVINLAALVIVQNILAWDLLPFLTQDFTEVVPWISLSLVTAIVVNLIYLFDDKPVVKSTGQIASNLVSIVATSQVLRVFPFDFSSYSFDWAIVVRIVLILAIVGAGIAMLTEVAKLVSRGRDTERR